MATIRKTDTGKWRVEIYVAGKRKSATHRTKREAESWAAIHTAELKDQGAQLPGDKFTLAELLRKYAEEVSPEKRGERWEQIRIAAMLRDKALPVESPLSRLTTEMLTEWRNARSAQVSPGSVLRDIGVLSAVLEYARRELKWISANPMADMRKPPSPRHRSVVITPSQCKIILRALGYIPGRRISEQRHAVAACFLLAMRTGMRAGELCGLTWDRVKLDHVVLPVTKTVPRVVPLSAKAQRIIQAVSGWDEQLVFGMKPQTLDALFRKYRDRAKLEGFTFHDTRHTAATMIAPKLDIMDLCKMFGWSNPKQAMVYYNPSPAQIAARLNARQ